VCQCGCDAGAVWQYDSEVVMQRQGAVRLCDAGTEGRSDIGAVMHTVIPAKRTCV
jgi:hypothetical protein